MNTHIQEKPQAKPHANLTKKGYSRFMDMLKQKLISYHILEECIDDIEHIVQDCFKESIGFDPHASFPREVIHRNYKNRKELLVREEVSAYEKYGKKSIEKKKEMFPGLPIGVISHNGVKELERIQMSLNKS
ncbi:hypothetical protein PBCVKS1B_006L [Paramecium bursaria Chlorella virus KS1B]|nr:hypothetical protein PBCVKS1B_006L [Paramecium bursaria Chlorella virus KS1B]